MGLLTVTICACLLVVGNATAAAITAAITAETPPRTAEPRAPEYPAHNVIKIDRIGAPAPARIKQVAAPPRLPAPPVNDEIKLNRADSPKRIKPQAKSAPPLRRRAKKLHTKAKTAVLHEIKPTANVYINASGRSPHYELRINKTRGTLLVAVGDQIEKEYRIAVGTGGKGAKLRRGDKRTPSGIYRITSFNDNSKFHLFMHLNYPNLKDAFYGLKQHRISRTQFNRIVRSVKAGRVPPSNTPLGGLIGIHGIGEITEKKLHIHNNFNWTEGCIAMTNDEIKELRGYVDIGTKVVIEE